MTKYVVLTGGSSGIGEKTLAYFSTQGWQGINLSRRPCSLPAIKNFNVDLSIPDMVEKLKDPLTNELHDATQICLIHNAAHFSTDNATTLSAEQLRHALEVNLVAAVILNTMLIPLMPKQSSILFLGSTLSEQAVPGRASYIICKHALIGLMRALCQDLVGKDITTACICPGFVKTNMLLENVELEKFNQFISQKVTAKRLIEPEEIAEFIYFCATHPIINGAVLHANLGQVMS